MDTRTTILSRIEAFIAAQDLSEREFGIKSVNDPKFVRRLRAGFGVTLRSIERAEAFMAENGVSEAAE